MVDKTRLHHLFGFGWSSLSSSAGGLHCGASASLLAAPLATAILRQRYLTEKRSEALI